MARVQYGSIITSLKGNIAGQTFQDGNVSKVLRNKGYRKGSTSPRRQAQNTSLMRVTSSWRGLTQGDRDNWNESAINWPFKDKFGNTYYGTGYQKYVAESVALIGLGFPLIEEPDMPNSAQDPGTFSLALSAFTSFIVSWSGTTDTDMFLQIFASPPLSAGRNSNNVKKKLIKVFNMNGSSSYDFLSDYQAVYADAPGLSKVVVKLQIRTQQFPIVQFPFLGSAIVTP